MLVSALVEKLQALQAEHGDCLVITDGGGAGMYDIEAEEICIIPPSVNWPEWCARWQGQTLISLQGNG